VRLVVLVVVLCLQTLRASVIRVGGGRAVAIVGMLAVHLLLAVSPSIRSPLVWSGSHLATGIVVRIDAIVVAENRSRRKIEQLG